MPDTNFPYGIGAPGLPNVSLTSPLNLPVATTPGTLFTITGGPIWVQMIYGIVTTVIQTQACNLKLSFKVGTLTAVDVCANAAISALAVGTVFIPITSFATAASVANLYSGFVVGPTAAGAPTSFVCGQQGVTTLITATTSATNTGQIQWVLVYVPFRNFYPTNPSPASGIPISKVTPIG